MTRRQRRVAVTGLGFVTPVGKTAAATWHALLARRSGVAPITLFDASGFSVRIAAEVKEFDPRHAIEDQALLKFASRSHAFALAAAEEALRDAGIRPESGDGSRWGCVVGSGKRGLDFAELGEVHRRCAPDGHFRPDRLLTDGFGTDHLAFCSQPNLRGAGRLAPPVRDSRLRHLGPHGLCVGEPGCWDRR